jgi:hypothetical protein
MAPLADVLRARARHDGGFDMETAMTPPTDTPPATSSPLMPSWILWPLLLFLLCITPAEARPQLQLWADHAVLWWHEHTA